jgi:hypothetical protein
MLKKAGRAPTYFRKPVRPGAASLRFSGCGFSRISSSPLKQLRVWHVFFRFGAGGLQELVEAEEFAA